MIDLGRAFKAPFEDRDWIRKTLWSFLWTFLVVTAPAVTGVLVAYIRGVARGDETLPEWDDFGKKWVDGLLVGIAGFIYFLPVLVLAAIFVGPALVAAAMSGSRVSDAFAGVLASGVCLWMIVAMIYGVGVSILFSAAIVNFAIKDSFGAFFEFGEILAKTRSNTGYFSAWGYGVLVSFGSSAITSALSSSGVGALLYPGVFYLATVITAHLLGQWAQLAYGVLPVAAYGGPSATPPQYPAPPSSYPPPPPAFTPDAPIQAPDGGTGTALGEHEDDSVE